MHDSLTKHAAQLARLAMMIRIGLESAESAIPGINDLLAELATLGVTDFQVEGPAIYCRPAGPSSAYDDSFVVYQAAIIQPGGSLRDDEVIAAANEHGIAMAFTGFRHFRH